MVNYEYYKRIVNRIEDILLDDNWTMEQLTTEVLRNRKDLKKDVLQLFEIKSIIPIVQQILIDNALPYQKTILSANLQPKTKYTIFLFSEFGMMSTLKITLHDVELTSYAQYDDAFKLVFTPYRKRNMYAKTFYNNEDMLIYQGWIDLPETALNNVTEHNGYMVKRSKYCSFDQKQFDEIIKELGYPYFKTIEDLHAKYIIHDEEIKEELQQIAKQNNGAINECFINVYGLTPRHVTETFNNKYHVELNY